MEISRYVILFPRSQCSNKNQVERSQPTHIPIVYQNKISNNVICDIVSIVYPIPQVKVVSFPKITNVDLLNYDYVLMTKDILKKISEK